MEVKVGWMRDMKGEGIEPEQARVDAGKKGMSVGREEGGGDTNREERKMASMDK